MLKSQGELQNKLIELIKEGTEHEWLDFKLAKDKFSNDKLGRYYSALSNGANLAGEVAGWLVMGVEDKTLEVKGTNYLPAREHIATVKQEIAEGLNTNSSFIEIHELLLPEGRILLFEIPAAPRNIPVEWKGHGYAREGHALVGLSVEKRDRIRKQPSEDWSGEVCDDATIDDLDPEALIYLRKKLQEVKSDEDYLNMPTLNLLNRLGLLVKGCPNNTSILFLGKNEFAKEHLKDLQKISWKYEDKANGIILRNTYEAPLITKLKPIQDEIERFNTQLSDLDLFRRDIKQYDLGAIEELLINSLVHRDWSIKLWNEIHQSPLEIRFTNHGIFHADLFMALTTNHRPPYTNPTMANFLQYVNLMEREGGGLQRVFRTQLGRGVRVTYKFMNAVHPPRVDFTLKGKVEDIDFAKLVLAVQNEMELVDLLLLDKIVAGKNQVGSDISTEEADRLRRSGFIEIRGRKNRKCFVSAELSESIGKKGAYVRQKGFTRSQKITMILNLFREYSKVRIKDVYDLFPDDVESTLRNLMSSLVKRGHIKRIEEPGGRANWYYVINYGDDF